MVFITGFVMCSFFYHCWMECVVHDSFDLRVSACFLNPYWYCVAFVDKPYFMINLAFTGSGSFVALPSVQRANPIRFANHTAATRHPLNMSLCADYSVTVYSTG